MDGSEGPQRLSRRRSWGDERLSLGRDTLIDSLLEGGY